MSFYENNLQAILKKDTLLGAYLHSISTNENFEVFMDKNDDLNTNLYDKKKDYIFYQTKPLDEITNQYNQLIKNKSRYPFIPFYGIGNGLLIKMLLNLDKYILVIEPEIELIYIALNLFDFSKEIENGKLKIIYEHITSKNQITEYLLNPDIKTFLKTYDLEIMNNFYVKFYKQNLIQINKIIVDSISHIINSEGNSANDSLIGLNHHLQHLPKMLDSFTLDSILNSITSSTAVIVSTGPSLAKQLPLLKKYQKHLTILCIDASLPILQKEKIKPDFVFSMERVEATSKFFENLDKELLKDTIFIPTSISHPKTIKNIEDMKQCISMRPFEYNKIFHLKKWGYIGIGMSAANMAFDFALLTEAFKNIIFIGQDLAFNYDGKTHSKGAIYGEKEQQYHKKQKIKIKGYYGDMVETTDIWKMFLTFIEKNIIDNKREVRVINSTEGGAFIEGAEHIGFEEILNQLDLKEKTIINPEKIPPKKQEYHLKKSKKLIQLYIKRLECIKNKTEKTFLEVMETIENLEKLNRDKDLEQIDFDKLATTISKIDKIKDILEEDRVLTKFKNITNPLIVSAELELAKIMVKETNTEIEKKVKMIDWIYEHKSWLFFLAGALENILYLLKNSPKF